jgi:signal transduction histidine kinase
MTICSTLTLLVVVLTLIGFTTGSEVGILQNIFTQSNTSPSLPHSNSSLWELLSFMLVSLTLLSLAIGLRQGCYPLVMTVIGLFVCSISFSMLLDKISGINTPILRFELVGETQTSIISAIGVSILGFGITLLAWREWNSLEIDMSELRRSFLVYCTIAAIFIAGISSWFALSLLHDRITEDSRRNLEIAAREKARSFKRLISRSKKQARRFANYGNAQLLLDGYDQGKLQRRDFLLKTTNYFDRVLEYDEDIAGITLLDKDGAPLVVIGQALSPDYWPKNISEHEQIGVLGPVKIDSDYHLVVSAPITQFPKRRIGTVILLLHAKSLIASLKDHTSLGDTGTITLGVPIRDKIFSLGYPRGSNTIVERLVSTNSIKNRGLIKALQQEFGFIGPRKNKGISILTVYLPVPDSSLALIATIETKELQTAVKRKFIAVAALIFLFVTLAGYGMFQLVRTLLWYADALQLRLLDKSNALEVELAWRTKAEKELNQYREHLEHLVVERTSELQESQRLLSQSERMASIGIFAAGIAHEINNPIGMILLAAQNASELSGEHDGPEITKNALEEIESNAQRCGRIVKSILQFSRQEETEKSPSDLNSLVNRAVNLVKNDSTNSNIDITLDLANELPDLSLNPTEIEQVVINLCKNAIEAGGNDTVIQISTKCSKESVELLVSDNGPGMNQEQKRLAFDPFFTTKQHRGGTGLGLSIVHGIIEGHLGSIHIVSSQDIGTTFCISFPLPT